MRRHLLLSLASLAALAVLPACPAHRPPAAVAPAAAPPAAPPSGIDLAGIDAAVAPGDDFFGHANGAWLKRAVIPPDRTHTGPFLDVLERVTARTRAIDEEAAAAAATAPAGSETQQIGDTYASYLDEAGIEARGLAPVQPELARLAALADTRALAVELGASLRADVDVLNATDLYTSRVLGLWVEQDLNQPSRNTAYLVQGGLGLPDRSYYLEPGERFVELRGAYRAHLAAMFKLAGMTEPEARALRVLAFETRLAASHSSRTETSEVTKGNNPWTRADFDLKAPGLDWSAFLGAARLDRQPAFIVWNPGAVTGLAALVKSEPLSTWKEYLAARALGRAARFLPRAFVDERFKFYGTTLSGTPAQLDRWKRAVDATDEALGDAVGKRYASRHFPAAQKAELQEMVAQLVKAFWKRIDALDWMAPATKVQARAKLATLQVGIAYPDRWTSYQGLRIVRGDALGNAERAEAHAYQRALAKLGAAPDRGEWAMLAQVVNAVNLPVRNALNFPAGMLEAPFYDRNASAAVKYGSIGAVIGHEISHSFDDQGSVFDATGKLSNWWTPEDLAHFEAAGAALVKQFDAYRPFPDLAVNGKLTLSENIADLAGLAVAYDGWRASLGGKEPPVLDGLSGDQQFFLAFAQSWREKDRDEALRQALVTDGHAPGRYRGQTVRNLDAWYRAFLVKPEQALYLAPEARVRVW